MTGAGTQAGTQATLSIGAWLEILEDGTVTVFTGKVEVGQNIRTSLAQAVADELRLPLSAVRLVMADTERTPFDPGTFGSRSTPGMAPQLRRAAAAAREALIDLAAARWEANRDDLRVEDGRVTHPETGQTLGFGELTQGQPLAQPVPEDIPITPAPSWQVAGRAAPKVGAEALVTGRHRFAADVKRPGMLYGKILRPGGFGATLRSLDTAAAASVPGVQVVRDPDDPDFVGVVAADEGAAERAIGLIRAVWDVPGQPSSQELFEYFKSHPADPPTDRRFSGGPQYTSGSLQEGLAAAERTLQQTYTAAYIAHAPLEPRAAVAEWAPAGWAGQQRGPEAAAPGSPAGDPSAGEASPGRAAPKLTVWTGTQRPFGVQRQLMEVFGLDESQVRVVVPDTGSGYGGKHYGDAAIEAARLARACGRPVRVLWTREEEFTWAYFRPAALIEITSGVRSDGTLTAWAYHNYNAGPAGIRTPYDVPHQHIEYHVTRTPLRQGSYRALAATANHFARESHLDELAHLVGMDPLAFRRHNLREPRCLAVLEAAAERFGWAGLPRTGRPREIGYGLALGNEKGSYIATCAEVKVDPARGQIVVQRVVAAFECGAIVNPDHLQCQVEGAVVQGLGGALYEAIEFAGGRILNPRFSQYRVPRFRDTPHIEVVLLDRKDLPSAGGGETPIVGIAPAVANAVFDATGLRLRAMPLRLDTSAGRG
ncbi:MAG TPA: molybdopterin cofactor-binding domain-containing protein [Chloroflexota bacterium]|nr:molybdopterin cofactor-binding domain-containing protein [Chloroflexota bacterium]